VFKGISATGQRHDLADHIFDGGIAVLAFRIFEGRCLAVDGIIIALALIFIFRANICNTFTNVGKYLWNKTPIEVKEFFAQFTQNQNSQTSQSISQQNINSYNNSKSNFMILMCLM
jgi:hypothetical protein